MSTPQYAWPDVAPRISSLIFAETLPALKNSFAMIDDALFDLSQSKVSADNIDVLRVMRSSKNALLEQWVDVVEYQTKNWAPSVLQEASTDSLSLLSFDDHEAKLAYDQMAESFYKSHSQLFTSLEKLWEEMASSPSAKTPADAVYKNAPLHHCGVSHMIARWLNEVDINIKAKVVVLKILEREIIKSLADLLPKVIHLLDQLGWSVPEPTRPQVNRAPVKSSVSSSSASVHSQPQQNAPVQGDWMEQVETIQPAPIQIPQAPAFPQYMPYFQSAAPTRPPMELMHALSQLMSQGGQAPETYNQNWHATQASSGIDETDWDPAISELVSLLERRRHQPTRSGVAMSSGAVYSVLENMQKDLPSSVKTAARQNDQTLAYQFKKEMLSKGVEMGFTSSRLAEHDEDAVDIVGMLFEIFLSERQMTDEMREHVARLLAPYVKVVLNDRKMFMHKSHPARKFLDVLAEACEGNMGTNLSEKNTLDKVTKSIDQLSAEFQEDITIFELVEQEIRSFLKQQRSAVEISERRAAEALKGKERLDQAEQQTQEYFYEALSNCNWPINTINLLKKYWCQHHKMMLLRSDHNPSAVSVSKQLLVALVEAGQKKEYQFDDQTNNSMKDMLQSTGLLDGQAQQVIDEIKSALLQAASWEHMLAQGTLPQEKEEQISTPEMRQQEIQETLVENTVLEDTALKETVLKEASLENTISEAGQHASSSNTSQTPNVFTSRDDLVEYFKNMEIGTWVDFVKPDGNIISTRLSWVSPISLRLLFVTAKGTKHAVESAEDLAKMVKLERLRLRETGLGENGFSHSFQKAITQLSQNLN